MALHINKLTDIRASEDDLCVAAALCNGDEVTFTWLLDQHQSTMLRLAMAYIRDRATAEEVVQETWIVVFQNIRRFQGRSSLKTWIFGILNNLAKNRAKHEGKYVSLSTFGDPDADAGIPSVSGDRFHPPDHPQWASHWSNAPDSWNDIPEDRFLSLETRAYIEKAIESLPANQRAVITLRDVEGWDAGEVCRVLGINDSNQRVLLHRARSKVRQALEDYLTE